MHLIVDDLEKGVGENNSQDIQIRLSGDNIKFVVTEYSISLFIDEDYADSLVFHLGAILQDRQRAKKTQKKTGQK